jgi:hypothetical protein
MDKIYVSVVATRRSTQTHRRSVHIVPVTYDGPSAAMERFATSIADEFPGQWEFNIMQITCFEYAVFQRKQLEVGASF